MPKLSKWFLPEYKVVDVKYGIEVATCALEDHARQFAGFMNVSYDCQDYRMIPIESETDLAEFPSFLKQSREVKCA